MKKEEMVRLTNMIAERTADIVIERLNGSIATKVDDDEYVDSKEAARILDVTPRYLCSMKDKFPPQESWQSQPRPRSFQKERTVS